MNRQVVAVTLASSQQIGILPTIAEKELAAFQSGAGSPGAGKDAGVTIRKHRRPRLSSGGHDGKDERVARLVSTERMPSHFVQGSDDSLKDIRGLSEPGALARRRCLNDGSTVQIFKFCDTLFEPASTMHKVQ